MTALSECRYAALLDVMTRVWWIRIGSTDVMQDFSREKDAYRECDQRESNPHLRDPFPVSVPCLYTREKVDELCVTASPGNVFRIIADVFLKCLPGSADDDGLGRIQKKELLIFIEVDIRVFIMSELPSFFFLNYCLKVADFVSHDYAPAGMLTG
ncbi:hypothetical protein [Methanospirillum sp.]|uniref:hypothetical protein n=1 Tax=Methanospirillum sp. TaxID=45200 RepID=UPI002607915F|nr:hypothetical protein [Methanospirillum sp.]